MKIFFAGHNNFGNRGCEALVRSVSALIRHEMPAARFAVPSLRPDLDERQWVEHAANGIELIQAQRPPRSLRYWHWARRAVPAVEHLGRPSHRLQADLRVAMSESDIVVMTGGDTISLDYDLPSLYDHAGYIDNAKQLGKKAVLWAASVGPFTRKPHVERLMRAHLRLYDQITVRESATFNYLRSLGIEGVVQVTDPAFTLGRQPVDLTELMPTDCPSGLLGLNVSPLIRKFRGTEASRQQLDEEVAGFARAAQTRGFGVVLLPHVGPLDGSTYNADHAYMADLVARYQLQSPGLALVPPHLNASQLKHVISQFRFFIGARTHATIAAFSTGVPTLSIAYSVKAKGINHDLFGDLPVVLDTPDVSCEALLQGLAALERHESELRSLLAERLPLWRQRAAIPAAMLAQLATPHS
jgi:colanic acid/amylovoran biosynthesis protein